MLKKKMSINYPYQTRVVHFNVKIYEQQIFQWLKTATSDKPCEFIVNFDHALSNNIQNLSSEPIEIYYGIHFISQLNAFQIASWDNDILSLNPHMLSLKLKVKPVLVEKNEYEPHIKSIIKFHTARQLAIKKWGTNHKEDFILQATREELKNVNENEIWEQWQKENANLASTRIPWIEFNLVDTFLVRYTSINKTFDVKNPFYWSFNNQHFRVAPKKYNIEGQEVVVMGLETNLDTNEKILAEQNVLRIK